MKRSNKTLYEKIMRNVSKVVKNILNESFLSEWNSQILDSFLKTVNYFCTENALGDAGVRYLIAAYTDEEKFNQISRTVRIPSNSIESFEDMLGDEAYEYMTDVNNGVTYDDAYARYCELYK